MKSIVVILSVLFICAFVDYVYSSCYASPGTRDPEPIGITTMDTCCWLHDDTCCAENGVAAVLSDIQNSLRRLVLRGISEQCYYSLANLECIACDPNQTIVLQSDGLIPNGNSTILIDQIFTVRLCTSLCKDIYSSCSDANSTAALGVTDSSNYLSFCETINGTYLTSNTNDVTAIFYSANFLVSDFDCYGGVAKSEIESDVGICLFSYTDCLIPEPIIYVNLNDSPSMSFSVLLFFAALLFIMT